MVCSDHFVFHGVLDLLQYGILSSMNLKNQHPHFNSGSSEWCSSSSMMLWSGAGKGSGVDALCTEFRKLIIIQLDPLTDSASHEGSLNHWSFEPFIPSKSLGSTSHQLGGF